MDAYLSTITLKSATGKVEDDTQMSLAWMSNVEPPDDDSVPVGILNGINAFMGANFAGGTRYLQRYLAPNRTQFDVDIYEITGHLDGSPHGSPVLSSVGGGLPATGGGGSLCLPEEVAACVTLKAIGQTTALVEAADGGDAGALVDRPRQRRTGRFYLGPLTTNALAEVGTHKPVLSETFRGDVLAAMVTMSNTVWAYTTQSPVTGCVLGVWSRSDATIREVESVYMDNAFDTQRRRGGDPTISSGLSLTAATGILS